MTFGLSQIPKQRLLIYILCLGVVPIVLAFLHNSGQKRALVEAHQVVSRVRRAVHTKQCKQAPNMYVREHHAEADHFYIDQNLESLTLMEAEAADLAALIRDDPSLPNRELLKRMEFLQGQDNQLRFATTSVETFAHMRESVEGLVHPVEVRQEDLPIILGRIEACLPGYIPQEAHPPQLLVTEFKLHRSQVLGENDVFVLNLKLIKREFL